MVTENADAQSLLAPSALWPMFEHNAVLLVGRDAGLLPSLPGVVILVARLAHPRVWTLWQGSRSSCSRHRS